MDSAWWAAHIDEVRESFKGRLLTSLAHCFGAESIKVDECRNSGAGAIMAAAHFGAERIILLGYDCQHTGGKTHWHGDHPDGLGNAGSVGMWPEQFQRLATKLKEVDIINCTRDTALTCFRRGDLAEILFESPKLPPLFVQGMHGMGDNLHQRAVVRELMASHEVWLETPWPSIFHDMPGVNLMQKGSSLRTQAKNLVREADLYSAKECPDGVRHLRIHYPPAKVRQHRGVLAAMSAQAGVRVGDFRMPVPWDHGLDLPDDRPILAFRPLVERSEWGGNRNRNPDVGSYLKLLDSIRDRFFVVSVADLEDRKEWMVHDDVGADLTLHQGELNFQQLAALWRDAAMVMAAPGFGVVLAQAVGTPVVSVFGGYEGGYSFNAGARFTPTLAITPIHQCDCFSHTHRCNKTLDLPRAIGRLAQFVGEHIEDVDRRIQAQQPA